MTEEEALLAAIIAHPDDDTPRLVYADWLDEHDQPKTAEYIRVQIARAGGQKIDGMDERELATRELALQDGELCRFRAQVKKATRHEYHALVHKHECHRGFPTDFWLTREGAENLGTLARLAPIRSIHLADNTMFRDGDTPEDVAPVIQRLMKTLGTIHANSLYLGGNDLGDLVLWEDQFSCLPIIQALADGLPKTNIMNLHLGNNHIGWQFDENADAQIHTLMQGIGKSKLRSLDMGDTILRTSEHIEQLASAVNQTPMVELSLQFIGTGSSPVEIHALYGQLARALTSSTLTNINTHCGHDTMLLDGLRQAYQHAAAHGSAAMFNLTHVNAEPLPDDIIALRDAARAAFVKVHTPTNPTGTIVLDAHGEVKGRK